MTRCMSSTCPHWHMGPVEHKPLSALQRRSSSQLQRRGGRRPWRPSVGLRIQLRVIWLPVPQSLVRQPKPMAKGQHSDLMEAQFKAREKSERTDTLAAGNKEQLQHNITEHVNGEINDQPKLESNSLVISQAEPRKPAKADSREQHVCQGILEAQFKYHGQSKCTDTAAVDTKEQPQHASNDHTKAESIEQLKLERSEPVEAESEDQHRPETNEQVEAEIGKQRFPDERLRRRIACMNRDLPLAEPLSYDKLSREMLRLHLCQAMKVLKKFEDNVHHLRPARLGFQRRQAPV